MDTDLSTVSARALAAAGTWDRVALARLAPALKDPTAVAVVAGQQPAVGGGPLYTLVKTAHAIVLARRLAETGVPAVAWFWCASEDHDLGEANHADLVLRDGSIERVSADLGAGRAALRWRNAARWWEPLTARCRDRFGDGLGGAWLLAREPRPDEGMGAWLCRLITDLCPGTPIAACEAHLLRPLWRHRLRDAVTCWPSEALETTRRELIAAGRSDPFGPLPEAPFFHDTPEGRRPLGREEALRLAETDPDALSPGAALRPVLQQLAMPGAISVLGPGEMAYHAAIGPVYAALGAARPQLIPRCSLTLLPAWAERAAIRLGLSPEALADGAAPDTRPPPEPDAHLATLAQAIDRLDGIGDGRVAAAQVRLRRELDRLQLSLARGARQAAGLPAPGTISALLRPRGKRQDRTLSLFQAIWEHGPGLMTGLIEAASTTPPGDHRVVRLG